MIRDIPRSRRNGREFADERELLTWLLARLTHPCRTQLKFDLTTRDEAAQLETTLGLFRAQLAHASAAHRLMRTKEREAAYPIVRTMLELWAEIAFINAGGINPDRVWAYRLWTLLILQESQPEIITASVDAFADRHPEVYARTAQLYRKRKIGHFSGQSRAAIIRQFCGVANAKVYKWLSWSCHPLVQGTAHVQFADFPSPGRTRIEHFRPKEATELDIALHASHSLSESWWAFHCVFGSRGCYDSGRKPGSPAV